MPSRAPEWDTASGRERSTARAGRGTSEQAVWSCGTHGPVVFVASSPNLAHLIVMTSAVLSRAVMKAGSERRSCNACTVTSSCALLDWAGCRAVCVAFRMRAGAGGAPPFASALRCFPSRDLNALSFSRWQLVIPGGSPLHATPQRGRHPSSGEELRNVTACSWLAMATSWA